MRLGWSLAAISTIAFLSSLCAQDLRPPTNSPSESSAVVANQDNGNEVPDDQKVVARKVVVPTISVDELRKARPLSDFAQAIDSKQIQVPADMDVDELVRYLGDLSTLSDELADDYRRIQSNLSQQQAKVAEAILANSEEISDEAFYQVATWGLAGWISRIPYATPELQEATYQLVSRQLEIGVKQGIKIDEVRNAMRTAELLERHGDRSLAAEACARFAGVLRSAGTDRYQETVEQLEDVCRRLDLAGKPLVLTGTRLDGTPIQWSDYRDKVVLVHFWASWSIVSLAELSQLKRYYETYQPRGFEIVGICLDENRREAEATVAKEEIPWVNLFEQDAGREHPMASKYGVRRVPTGFLVDRSGKIVSTQARGSELEQWINRLFGPETFVARELVVESKWADAAVELQKLIDQDPENVDYRVALGAVQLLGDDPLGYAGTCQASRHLLLQEETLPSAQLVPLFCLPGNHPVDRDPIYQIAVKIRDAEDSTASRLALIMSAYRSRRDEACLKEEVIEGDFFSIAASQLVRSMAAHRIGRSEEAIQWLNVGRRIVALRFNDYLSPAPPENVPYEHWICCAVAQLLLAESQRIVVVDQPPPTPQP